MNKSNIAFKAWRKRSGFSHRRAAKALGISTGSVFNYCEGKRYGREGGVDVPKIVLLACSAIENNLLPIGSKE